MAKERGRGQASRPDIGATQVALSMRVRCSKLIVKPPSGERTSPVIWAEMAEVTDGASGRVVMKDIEESAAEALREGLLEGRTYDIEISMREAPDAQGKLDLAGAHADAN